MVRSNILWKILKTLKWLLCVLEPNVIAQKLQILKSLKKLILHSVKINYIFFTVLGWIKEYILKIVIVTVILDSLAKCQYCFTLFLCEKIF